MGSRSSCAALLVGAIVVGCTERSTTSSTPIPTGPPPAAAAPPPLAAPDHVVVRTATAPSDFARFSARCFPGERLVGGGCGGGCAKLETSEPIEFHPTDTDGAGWLCKCGSVASDSRPIAYALCQGTAPDAGPPPPAVRPGRDFLSPF